MRRVEIEVWGEGLTRRRLSVLQEDESPSGVALPVPMPISVGAKVRVHKHNCERVGTVRNCRRDASEYIIGIQYDPVVEEDGNAAPDAVNTAAVEVNENTSPDVVNAAAAPSHAA
jgi:hypothetical protein